MGYCPMGCSCAHSSCCSRCCNVCYTCVCYGPGKTPAPSTAQKSEGKNGDPKESQTGGKGARSTKAAKPLPVVGQGASSKSRTARSQTESAWPFGSAILFAALGMFLVLVAWNLSGDMGHSAGPRYEGVGDTVQLAIVFGTGIVLWKFIAALGRRLFAYDADWRIWQPVVEVLALAVAVIVTAWWPTVFYSVFHGH